MNRNLVIHTEHGTLYGQLDLPESPTGLVVLARARHIPVDSALAARLNDEGFATLCIELLTAQEAQFVDATHNVPRLTQRLIEQLEIVQRDGDMATLPLALLAHGDTTPAAVRAASQRDHQVLALACHGGQIDRAGRQALDYLRAPLLLMFDPDDEEGPLALQRAAPHLQTRLTGCTLAAGDDPVAALAPWLRDCLPARSPPGEILDFSA